MSSSPQRAEGRVNGRLAHEASPYLRSAASQPVDWHAWGADAFAQAKREDKPVLLDVGAVWCHWCHVMDHESYDDPEVARLINERFVAIKVDRDERPDVDARYQQMVGAITGQGGWPLTGFLTPEGNVFYGGTYFPPREVHGRPSFRRVLEAVADAYRDNRAQIMEQAEKIHATLRDRAQTQPRAAGSTSPLSEALLDEAVHAMGHEFDAVNGGWGNAPKFPHPSAVEFLLASLARKPSESVKIMVQATLERMGKGGVYDQVGGGFHRYSVDARWIVPHFEKMLYDNAELLRNYVLAWKHFHLDFYKEKAEDVVRFMDGVLSDRALGGFYGSQDADVGVHDDGDYFTWTLAELREALGNDPALVRIMGLHLDVDARGDMHHNPEKNVLWTSAEPTDIAATLGRSPAQVMEAIERGMTLLRAARAARPAPFVDPVLYANWNAMAIRGYLEFGAAFGREDATRFALQTLDRFLSEGYDPARGFKHTLGGKAVWGLLDDNAQMLPALVMAFNVTQEARYLDRAREVADLLAREFAEDEGAALRDTARTLHAHEQIPALQLPQRPIQDAPTPSANARAAEGLLMLHALSGKQKDAEFARSLVDAVLPSARRFGLFSAAMFTAAHLLVHPPASVVVAGPAGDARVKALAAAALANARTGSTLRVVTVDAEDVAIPAEAIAFARGPARDRPGAVVCLGERCLAPVHAPEDLAALLSGARS